MEARQARATGAVRVGNGRKAAPGSSPDRLTPVDYVEVGLAVLAESGVQGVTIASACARLGVTKGSFYHHFSSVSELHEAMLDHWEELYGQTRPAALADLAPMERLDALIDAAADREHSVEAAIRTWSRTDERVAAAQRRLDDLRVTYVSETLEALGVTPERCRVLAEMGLAMLTGFQTRAAPIDRRLLHSALAEWRRVLHAAVGHAAARSGAAPGTTGPPGA